LASLLNSLTRRDAVLAALNEFSLLGRDAFLQKHGFGRAREYFVVHPNSGEWCDSKAIAGVALSLQNPEVGIVTPSHFSGGEATVAERLRQLGFEVIKASDAQAPSRSEAWSRDEVALVVADYLAMLAKELTGQRYNKSERRRALSQRLNGRSEAAIEFKHANISAVMLELGFPYLRGYQPRSNYQHALLDEVTAQIAQFPVLDAAAEQAVQTPAVEPEVEDFERVLVPLPKPKNEPRAAEPVPGYVRAPIRRDYLEREARNRSLGEAGELFALRFERWRLIKAGREQLAEKVEHVSHTRGDGLGYDILSFDPNGRERFVEVKTTAFGSTTPFFASAREVQFAREQREQFCLLRVFEFRADPRLFELPGAIEQHCRLDPANFLARLH
jgi:hypothetical protein